MSSEYDEPTYRAKIKQSTLNTVQPTQNMPQKAPEAPWQPDAVKSTFPFKWAALGLGIASFIGFSLFEAVASLVQQFDTYPVSTVLLGGLLGCFVAVLIGLIGKETRGYFSLKKRLHEPLNLDDVAMEDSSAKALARLREHADMYASHSYAARCFTQFEHSVNSDISVTELVETYRFQVQNAVAKKASEILKRESMVSGSLSFISPNNLIQTLMIVWISLRTIRRLSAVYGVRPSTTGTVALTKVLLQNLAANSLFDLATDEVTNQISGSLAAKFMENSAEAVAAGALNVRLGRALIKLLK